MVFVNHREGGRDGHHHVGAEIKRVSEAGDYPESSGIIRDRVTLLEAEKIGLGVTIFVLVRTNQHHDDWLERFTAAIDAIPEILEFYRLSGDADYLLRVVAQDIKAYDEIYKRLIKAVDLLDVSSSFVMETLKFTTALPLDQQ